MIMMILAVLSIITYLYGLYTITREIILIDSKSHLSSEYKKVHLSLLFYNIVLWVSLITWMLTRKGFMYGINQHIIQEAGWLFLIACSQVMTSTSRYFRKLRLNQNLVLDYKREVKRTLNWVFTENYEFDKIIKLFIKKNGEINKDYYYLSNTKILLDDLKNLKKGETIDFGSETYLERVSDSNMYEYIYYNNKPLIFGIHKHDTLNEIITPLEHPVEVYLFNDNDKMEKHVISVGETFTTSKNINHAAIFTKKNSIKINWE